MTLAERLALAYSALLRGLLFPGSESDTPYQPFAVDFEAGRALTAESFRSAARLAQWWRIELASGSAFLDRLEASSADPDVGNDPDAAAAYAALHAIMRTSTSGRLQAITARAPESLPFHKTRHYVLGRVPGGGLAGILALSVET
jgi:Nuclease A inhibitor-like protein